jgi:hypothetical protein
MSEEIMRRRLGQLIDDAERGSPTELRRFAAAARAAALELSRDNPVVGGRPLPQIASMLRELASRAETNAFAKSGTKPGPQRLQVVRPGEAFS